MNHDDFVSRYGVARQLAARYRPIDAVKQKLQQQFAAFERHGVPVEIMEEWYADSLRELDRERQRLLRQVASCWRGSPLDEWRRNADGLGPFVLVIISLCPPLPDFPNPAKFWKYIGLHADRASDRSYNARLKAWALFRVAEPCVKLRRSPYRAVYDRRKERLPLMLPDGECETCDQAREKRKITQKAGWDCHNMGGPHYKAAHRHVDAVGITAKAIFLDAWRVSHGHGPKHSTLENEDA